MSDGVKINVHFSLLLVSTFKVKQYIKMYIDFHVRLTLNYTLTYIFYTLVAIDNKLFYIK